MTRKLRVLSLFSGIGAPERALMQEHIPFELVAWCEKDKYAAKSYSMLYNESLEHNLGDITQVSPQDVPDCDLIFHGSPCQSFSIFSHGDGGVKGSGTKSSLMWCTVEIVRAKKPEFVIWENVPNVLSKKHLSTFLEYLEELDKMGYSSAFDTLNALDYGVPQNRLRLFCISRRRLHEKDC